MTIFISRPSDVDSVFTTRLRAAGHQVSGESLVELKPLPFGPPPPADWIFFASRNAVRFFFEALPVSAPMSAGVRLAALGPATAEALQTAAGRVDFCGNGLPGPTAEDFAAVAAGQTVLFPAARHSQQSIPRLLEGHIRALHLPVYDNTPVPDPEARTEEVLVFTSPLNARAYISVHALLPAQQVVAIGPSTAGALAELGIRPAAIAPEPSEAGLADAVLMLRS